jgi:hypothetical protein
MTENGPGKLDDKGSDHLLKAYEEIYEIVIPAGTRRGTFGGDSVSEF